jgi:hypothetical protein
MENLQGKREDSESDTAACLAVTSRNAQIMSLES